MGGGGVHSNSKLHFSVSQISSFLSEGERPADRLAPLAVGRFLITAVPKQQTKERQKEKPEGIQDYISVFAFLYSFSDML